MNNFIYIYAGIVKHIFCARSKLVQTAASDADFTYPTVWAASLSEQFPQVKVSVYIFSLCLRLQFCLLVCEKTPSLVFFRGAEVLVGVP